MHIKKTSSPDTLADEWDNRTDCYYLKKEFLTHLHRYNSCKQRYYELFENGVLLAGTVVYTLEVNFFTFSGLKLAFPMQVIGMPVSIASAPLAGDGIYAEYLLQKILECERGFILGLNFAKDYCRDRVVNMRTLPTVVMDNDYPDHIVYLNSLRHPYRRRIRRNSSRFENVSTTESYCADFTQKHYQLYLDIMKRTTTKLEILSFEFFLNLPRNFILTSHEHRNTLLAWQICMVDGNDLFFLFGGLNYEKRDEFGAYYNNILSIVTYAQKNAISRIDFGQTAELVKMRFGGMLSERRMFMYHKNVFIRTAIKFIKSLIEYSDRTPEPHVFKD